MTEAIGGGEWLARTLAANGTTHVFWVDAVLRRTLIELGVLGVTRVLAHTEKGAAYMADGYARVAGRPGICFAQSVGAANLAAARHRRGAGGEQQFRLRPGLAESAAHAGQQAW